MRDLLERQKYTGRWTFENFDRIETPDDYPELSESRRKTRINTYTVLGPNFIPDDYPLTYGG